jgi:hypothetical protein
MVASQGGFMTRSAFVTAIAATASIVVGCSQNTSLSGPTAASAPLAGASPALAAGPRDIPVKGRLEGVDEDSDFTSNSVVVTTRGTGNSTLLGAFRFTQVVTVSFLSSTDAGSAHFIAANGDEIETTVNGSGQVTETPGQFSITDHHTITGGTGRFAGVRGSFDVDRVASGITFLTSGSFEGTMTSPGGAH